MRFFEFLTVPLLAGALFGCLSAQAADTIKIGSMIPQTGPESSEATVLTNAAKLAVKQVNAAGGAQGKQLELVFADTKSGPSTALQAYEKLIDQEHVTAIVAPFKSAQIVALVLKAQKARIPTFIGGTNTQLTENGNQWLFRARPDDSIAAQAMVTLIKEDTKFTKVGILHDNGALGTGGSNLVMKDAAAAGLKVVKNIGFDFGAKDFETPIKAIKDAGAEVLVIYAANLDESGRVLQAYAKVGKPMFCVASASSMSKVSLDLAKEAADGIYGVVDFAFGSTNADKKYLAEYRAEYHDDPDPIASYGYDAVNLLTKAMSSVGEKPDKIRQYLLGVKDYEGVVGTYSFNAKGDGLHSVSVVKVAGGRPKFVRTIKVQ